MAPMTLYYFEFPGRAEAARLLLTIGKVPFEDKRIAYPDWPAWKPKMPFGQMPVLEVDGKMLTQMAAIDRYCAAITGMLPTDPLILAEAEQAYCFIADIWEPLMEAMSKEYNPKATDEEKTQAWKDLVAPDSKFSQRMALLDKFIAKMPGKYLAGDQLTHADLSVFGSMSLFQSGWMAGMPKDILSHYPALKAFRQKIASIPEITTYYSKQADDPVRRTGFLPDGHSLAPAAEAAAQATA